MGGAPMLSETEPSQVLLRITSREGMLEWIVFDFKILYGLGSENVAEMRRFVVYSLLL